MKYFLIFVLFLVSQSYKTGVEAQKAVFTIDELWVCDVKRSCLECLRLPHCSWCKENEKCFSKNLPDMEKYCDSNATHYVDYGMSFEKNAECACNVEGLENNCTPPGDTEDLICSGRGICQCGRCVCNSAPDPYNVTKTIMGEYCEFDNFSCDGPKCNEGPYHINQIYEDIE